MWLCCVDWWSSDTSCDTRAAESLALAVSGRWVLVIADDIRCSCLVGSDKQQRPDCHLHCHLQANTSLPDHHLYGHLELRVATEKNSSNRLHWQQTVIYLPITAMRVTSTPKFSAWAKKWRAAVRQSSNGSGNGFSGARQYLQTKQMTKWNLDVSP